MGVTRRACGNSSSSATWRPEVTSIWPGVPVLREASEMNRELGASRGSAGILEFPANLDETRKHSL